MVRGASVVTVRVIQNTFNSGEISPQMLGRSDLPAYKHGVKTMENWLLRPQGGVVKRSGTRFVLEVEDSAVQGRLVPFVFSTTQAYILEFCDLKIRVFRNEGPIEDPAPPPTYYEIVTTYTEAQLPYLRFAQSADKLYITHEDHAPAVLTRTAHTTWTLADLAFIDGPYLEMRVPAVGDDAAVDTILVSLAAETGNNIAMAAVAPGFFSGARDVGRIFRYGNTTGTAWGGVRIDQVTSALVARGDIVSGDDAADQPPHLPGAANSKYWHIGAYYPANYPRNVSFFEQRLAFAGTPLEPERFDASVTGGWNDFAPSERLVDGDVVDDSALSYQLGGSSDVQVILWLARARNMVIGTTGGVWIVQASSNNESVTPTNINVPRASAYGCANLQPVVAYNTVVYVSRSSKKVLAAGYSIEADSYSATDLTLMSEHITGDGLLSMEFQHEPHSVVWCVRDDGQLVGMTYEPTQKIFGWHRHIIGGTFGSDDAVVESIAVIPAPAADHDQIWMIVKRTINGSTVRYIEFMEQDFADTDDDEDAFFVDSGYTYDSTATDTITGLDHLEGETVQILADGAVHPDCVVSSGSITLNASYSVVHVGYSYNADLETLPMEIQSQTGSSAGKLLRPTHAYARLHRTLGLWYGSDTDDLEQLPFRNAGDPMDAPPPLFTGIKEIILPHGDDFEAKVYLRQSDPLPAMVLFVAGNVGVSS